MKLSLQLAALGLASAVTFSTAAAQEADFLSRFAGNWSGTGLVARNEAENTNKVTCKMTGSPTATAVSMSGTCRAAVVFTRKISADIKSDPGTGRYTGTYVGSSIGPASLSGKRQGDAVVLTITWPKPVRGDKTATMTIQNSGSGRVGITVADQTEPGGPTAQVTNLQLSQS